MLELDATLIVSELVMMEVHIHYLTIDLSDKGFLFVTVIPAYAWFFGWPLQ